MMGKVKGCGNESCEAHQKKKTYKCSETVCSKCGNSLVYVCKDCYTQLPDETDKYCVRCHAKYSDRNHKAKKGLLKVGGVVITFGTIYKVGKNALEFAKKIKG